MPAIPTLVLRLACCLPFLAVVTPTRAPAGSALATAPKVTGFAYEFASNILHPNGNTYDQVLLTGAAATVTADPGQVTRTSFIDLSDDIVQIEFSGPGTLAISLENVSGPATALNYNQPAVQYVKGHATLTLSGTDETTHLSAFTVGTATAVNQNIFKPGITYDGVADLALLSVASPTNRLGSLRLANTEFSAASGRTGIDATGLRIGGPVNVHNISASTFATPVLLTGTIDSGQIGVTGGDLFQPNARPIAFGTAQKIAMLAGTTSHHVAQPVQTNRGTVTRDGTDVTVQVVQNSPDGPYKNGPGPCVVAPFSDENWYDAARGYLMPVRIYAPATGSTGAPFPTVVLSHGLAGSIGAFDELSTYLSSHGYICVMIQHADLRPDSRIERPLDVTFAITRLTGSPANPLLAGRVDPTRIAVIGHSFGAFTTLAVLGARYHEAGDFSPIVSFPDTRVKCGVALSPQGATTLGLFSGSWDLITRPAMTMHGTDDVAPGTTEAITRRQPFDEMPGGNKAHLTLLDGIHSDFSDTGIAEHGTKYTQWYFPATVAFLDTHLSNHATARAWLNALTLTKLSTGVAVLEVK